MNNWDPMREDFLDSRSSAISNSGPLKYFSRQTLNDERTSLKEGDGLYIKNIPMDMTKDALLNVLSSFGNVLSVYIQQPNEFSMKYNKLVGHAKVGSLADSLAIIAALNKKEPLNLLIEKALTEEEKIKRKNKSVYFLPTINDRVELTNQEDKALNPLKHNSKPIRSLKQLVGDLSVTTSSKEIIKEAGRKVSPDAEVKIKSSSSAMPVMTRSVVHISKGNGKPFRNPLPCVRCNIIGTKRCAVCKAYYCSKLCQEDDWYYHKTTCSPPPELVETNRALSIDEITNSAELKPSHYLELIEKSGSLSVLEKENYVPNHITEISFDKTFSSRSSIKDEDTTIAQARKIENVSNSQTCSSENSSIENCAPTNCVESIMLNECLLESKPLELVEVKVESATSVNENIISSTSKNNNVLDGSPLLTDIPTNKTASRNKMSTLIGQLAQIRCSDNSSKVDSVKRNNDITNDLDVNKIYGIDSNESFVIPTDNKEVIKACEPLESDISIVQKEVNDTIIAKFECGKTYEVYIVFKESVENFTVIAQFENINSILSVEQTRLSAGKSLLPSQLSNNDIVVAKSVEDSDWYRAKVCSVEKDVLIKVLYLDYGNYEVVKEVKSLPQEFSCSAYPGLAMIASPHKSLHLDLQAQLNELIQPEKCIKFRVGAKKSNSLKVNFIDDFDHVLAVYILKPCQLKKINLIEEVCFDVTVPSIAYQKYETTKVDCKHPLEKYYKNQLKPLSVVNGEEYTVILTWIMEDLSLWLQVVSDENIQILNKIIENTEKHCLKAAKPENLKENELVCVFCEGIWYRGEIVGNKDELIYVHFLDFGNTDAVREKDIRVFDASLLEFPILCCHVEPLGIENQKQLAENIFKSLIQKEEKCKMEVISLNPVQAIVKDMSQNCLIPDAPPVFKDPTVSKSKCQGKFFRNQLMSLTIESGKVYTVLPTWIMEDLSLWLQIISEETQEMLLKVLQDTTTHCEKADLPAELQKNELICVFYEEMWYRGEVISVKNEHLSVHFLDFGNTDFVPSKNIRKFDLSLRSIPALCVNVQPIYAEQQRQQAEIILRSLIDKQEVFKMEVISLDPLKAVMKDSSENPLIPTEVKGTENLHPVISLSHESSGQINKVTSDIKQEPSTKKVLKPLESGIYKSVTTFWDDCKVVTLPMENNVPVIIMKASDPNNLYIVPEKESKLFENLEDLSAMINEYCETFTNPFYSPKVSEVCLAKYSEDGKWYRAACIQTDEESAMLFFVDYGNIESVPFRSICQMVEIFLDIPLFVLHCILGDKTKRSLSSSHDDYVLNFATILPTPSINMINVLAQNSADSTYVIEIPSLCSSK